MHPSKAVYLVIQYINVYNVSLIIENILEKSQYYFLSKVDIVKQTFTLKRILNRVKNTGGLVCQALAGF